MHGMLAALLLFQAAGGNVPPTSNPPTPPPQATPAPAIPSSAVPEQCVVKALTPVQLRVLADLASDKNKAGDRFPIELAEPLDLGNGFVIPVGARGEGEVVHAAKSGAMGRAGELVLAARYLDFGGTRIPLRSFECGTGQGQDRTGETVAVDVLLGPLLGALVTGGEVRVPAGTKAHAKVRTDVIITRPGPTWPQGSPPPKER